MANITAEELEQLNTPGLVVEVDKRTAEELGAIEEDALSEEDALAATEETSPAGTANDGSTS
jgi:hypothetical protein